MTISLAIALVATGIATSSFQDYFRDPDSLYRSFYHDRNSHLSFGMDLGIAMRSLDPVSYLSELEKAKVWPPLHGVMLGLIMFIGGIDYRLGIIPSLVGWTATVVLTALIARNLFTTQLPGLVAAVLAATLTATSPAFRLLGSDVMFEGVGAALSALALWSYQGARQHRAEAMRWRILALVLTCLFFHKANYWGLVAVSVAAAFVAEDFRDVRTAARNAWDQTNIKAHAFRLLHHPLVYGSLIVFAFVFFLYWRGPTEVQFFGWPLRLYPPENLTTVAYGLLFARLLIWWRTQRADIEGALGIPGRALLHLHLLPIAVWFLLPKRLTAFFWYIGPSNSLTGAMDPWGGLALYADAFAQGFHVAPWIAVLVCAFAVFGLVSVRRLTPGAPAVFFMVIVCSLALLVHPQHQGRFLATWIFSVWIAAGAGLGVVFQRAELGISIVGRTVAALTVLALFTAVIAATPWPMQAYKYAIRSIEGPSDLDLVRPYLKSLDGAEEVMFVTTFGSSKLFNWVIHQNCRCNVKVRDPFLQNVMSREDARRQMASIVDRSSADRIVLIDTPSGRYSFPLLGWTYAKMSGIIEAMEQQSRFRRHAEYVLSSEGGQATVWVRQ